MKKRDFLMPVAVAAGALAVTPIAGATESHEGPTAAGINQRSSSNTDSRIKVPTSPNRTDAFVLNRHSDGTLIAQHESHFSHESHVSHDSHASHYSSSY